MFRYLLAPILVAVSGAAILVASAFLRIQPTSAFLNVHPDVSVYIASWIIGIAFLMVAGGICWMGIRHDYYPRMMQRERELHVQDKEREQQPPG